MKGRAAGLGRVLTHALLGVVIAFFCAQRSQAQGIGQERTFTQSKARVEKALLGMQAATAGRLPVLDGFATSVDHPLDRYLRGYYQAKFQVTATPSGGSIVRVSVEVTAWYADPVTARSGYQLLTSNGRLEADLLDQLGDELSGKGQQLGASVPVNAAPKPFPSEKSSSGGTLSGQTPAGQASSGEASSGQSKKTPAAAEPSISAPVPRLPETRGGLSSSLAQSLAEQEKPGAQTGQKKLADVDGGGLRAELESLEEVLKNQSHPKNLVAVKKSGTPVVATASLTAKTLFLASAHDEFEMLDFNRDWVHVRISGLSRGWIWRNNLEMPDGVPDSEAPASVAPGPVAAELFHVTREETAPFPGDWAPLRGKSVRIVSVEKINEGEKDAGPQVRLEFTKSVLDKDYAEMAQKPQEEIAGIVVIFDAVDGGMIAAALPTLQQWKAGKLSDAAMWHQCFFDPPETFNAAGAGASQ
ncbi:MAG TPA: hypothetical protein VK706_11970 [Candidatus Sulfotelmatobacter sp.]|jgi:hypothetical protein|nr:hypothetical protein [Candidatus Sulfotelmatobacter sp.]